MVTYKQASIDNEFHQILKLQQQNLPKNLTKKELSEEGFLTVEHSFELLKKMNYICPHTIAVENDAVIGYALSMHPKFAKAVEVLKPMFNEINHVISKDSEYIIMGQICVAKPYRGQGIFRKLYQNMQRFLSDLYPKIITEVDTENHHSLNAHKAIGFKELKRYLADEKEWSLVILE